MDFSIYLAFTGAESAEMTAYPGKKAWFGCRFSSHSSGLTIHEPPQNKCDALILTDETPPNGHDPDQVSHALAKAALRMECQAIILDFQRAPTQESQALVKTILKSAPCAVIISAAHSSETDNPILLNPPPLWMPLAEAIAPWKGRDIWLEIGPESGTVSLKEEGSTYSPCDTAGYFPFRDDALHLSYRIERLEGSLRFLLQRTANDLPAFLTEAKALGVTGVIGLYQELGVNLIQQIPTCNRLDL